MWQEDQHLTILVSEIYRICCCPNYFISEVVRVLAVELLAVELLAVELLAVELLAVELLYSSGSQPFWLAEPFLESISMAEPLSPTLCLTS